MEILALDLELGKFQNVTWASARRILDKGQTIATLGIEAWVYPFVVMPWVATRIGKMPDLQIRCGVSTDKIRDMMAR